VRAGRSQSAVAEKLAALERAARGSDNLMPPIMDAAAVYATVGEISDCLRGVFGEYREV
jgi:methylmalonyl-CoA mutase N-terminal domain/subunit